MALARQIALLATLAAALLAIAGCGGDDTSSADIDPGVAESINAKLDQVQERATEGNCTGDNSAESALTSLRDDIPDLLAEEDEQFVSDLTEMLDELGTQIDEQCEQAEEEDTTSTSTTTTETETEPTTTEETTTEETTTDTKETTSSTTTEETTTEPPDNPDPPTPPGGGGTGSGTPPSGNPGGSGGFTPGRKAGKPHKGAKPDKPKKPKDHEK